jgi:hypothetical protein
MLESSPWYKLYSFAPPHFPFCGEISQGWVADPVDTYSSLLYIFASLLIFKEAKRGAPPILRNIGYIPIVVALGSILFHMSFTFTFLVADFLGIFFLNFYGIFLNFRRLNIVAREKIGLYSFIGTVIYAILMGLTYQLNIHSGLLMLPLLFVYLSSEVICYRQEEGVSYKSYWTAFLLISFGYGAMLIEGPPFRLGCLIGPYYGKVQLHTIWHFLSALSMIFIFRFYNQEGIKRAFLNSSLEPQKKN